MPWLICHTVRATSPRKAAALRLHLPFCLPQWPRGHVMRHALFSDWRELWLAWQLSVQLVFGAWHACSGSTSESVAHSLADGCGHPGCRNESVCVCMMWCMSHKWKSSRWRIFLECFVRCVVILCLKSSIRLQIIMYLLCFSLRWSDTVAQEL